MTDPAWKIPRRRFLRGAGWAIALPLLEAMLPRTAWANEPRGRARAAPVRFAGIFMPNGVPPGKWTPAPGALAELTPILAPLERVKDEALVLSGLWHAATNQGDGHYFKDAAWLTGTTIHKTTGADIDVGGVSLDQLIAQKVGQSSKLPSLELGLERLRTGVDNNVGITQLYGGHISWSSPTTPVAREIDPKQAFDRLFRDQAEDKDGAKRPAGIGPYDDASILDAVADDTASVKGRLGSADARKLDEYLTSVRDVERRIQQEQKRASDPRRIDPAALRALPLMADKLRDGRMSDRREHGERVKAMLDLMALAFWTDATRVATLMLGVSVSGVNFSFLSPELANHHEFSHHEGKADKLAGYEKISTWYVEQLAYFVERLKGIKEGGGTLLDRTLVLFGSGLSDGNAHDPHDVPTILAGGRGCGVKPGRHLALPRDSALCNVHLEIARRMGIKLDAFGDSTGGIPGIEG